MFKVLLIATFSLSLIGSIYLIYDMLKHDYRIIIKVIGSIFALITFGVSFMFIILLVGIL